MPNTITNYGTEVCGTLTRRHDSSPYYQGGQNVVAQPCVIGFKAGQSPDGGLGLEREVCPTLSATPSALEPTVCHPVASLHRPAARALSPKRTPREIWIGQIGTTERLGNNKPFVLTACLNFQGSKGNNVVSRDETCFTLNCMHGHDVHVVAQRRCL